MSGGLDVLQMKEEDVLKFLAAGTHLGGTNLDFQMDQYVYKRKSDGKWLCGFYNASNMVNYLVSFYKCGFYLTLYIWGKTGKNTGS